MNELAKLKDIKPNVEITDYLFFASLIALSIFVLILIYLIYRLFTKNKNESKQFYLNKLKNLNYEDSKKTAYEFSEYARFFLNEENRQEYETIYSMLEKYKYKPEVENLSEEVKEKIKKFIEEIK